LNQRGRCLRLAGRVSSRESNLGCDRRTAGSPPSGGRDSPLGKERNPYQPTSAYSISRRVKRRFISPMRHHPTPNGEIPI